MATARRSRVAPPHRPPRSSIAAIAILGTQAFAFAAQEADDLVALGVAELQHIGLESGLAIDGHNASRTELWTGTPRHLTRTRAICLTIIVTTGQTERLVHTLIRLALARMHADNLHVVRDSR